MSSLPRQLPAQHKTNTRDELPCRLRDWNPAIKLLQTYTLYFTAARTGNIAFSGFTLSQAAKALRESKGIALLYFRPLH